jgi:hypothetical protein
VIVALVLGILWLLAIFLIIAVFHGGNVEVSK